LPQEGKTPQLRRLAHNRIHAAIVQTNVLAAPAAVFRACWPHLSSRRRVGIWGLSAANDFEAVVFPVLFITQ
jgi:hypothetical protein